MNTTLKWICEIDRFPKSPRLLGPDLPKPAEAAIHPLHAFPVFYENAFLFNLANRIIFCGPKSAEAASIVGATAAPTWEDAWRLACQTVGSREPTVMVTPNVGARMPLLWRVQT